MKTITNRSSIINCRFVRQPTARAVAPLMLPTGAGFKPYVFCSRCIVLVWRRKQNSFFKWPLYCTSISYMCDNKYGKYSVTTTHFLLGVDAYRLVKVCMLHVVRVPQRKRAVSFFLYCPYRALSMIKSHNIQSNNMHFHCCQTSYTTISCNSIRHVSIPHGIIIGDSYRIRVTQYRTNNMYTY
jgi:hypothetical protein